MPVCKNCGQDVPGTSVFCSRCGARLPSTPPEVPAPPEVPVPPKAPAVSGSAVAASAALPFNKQDKELFRAYRAEVEKARAYRELHYDFPDYAANEACARKLPFPPRADEEDEADGDEFLEDKRDRSTGIFCYIGLLLLFSLPGVGLLATLIALPAARRKSTRNFAAAVLILRLTLAALAAGGYFLLHWFSPATADMLRDWLLATAGQLAPLLP